MKKIITFIILILLSINTVWAEEEKEFSLHDLEYNSFFADAPNPEDVMVLRDYVQDGMKFIYLGETNSVDVWLSVKQEGTQILSTTIDGKAMMVGSVYDENGDNLILQQVMAAFPNLGEALYILSQKEVGESIVFEIESFRAQNEQEMQAKKQVVPKKTGNVNKAIWESLQSTNYIERGNPNAPTVYIFSDVFCGHCDELSRKLSYYIDRNLIKVRYIPVGILSEASVTGALGILSSVNPKAAWADYYDNNNAMILKTQPTEEGLDKLAKNLEVFDKWKLRGTPSLFYKTNSEEVKFLYGQPENIEEFINETAR